MNANQLPVAVIGAGPVGLAAAAHLAERGMPFVMFEIDDDVAASVRDWAHVQLFSPWSYNIDPAARRLLEASGWSAPDPDEPLLVETPEERAAYNAKRSAKVDGDEPTPWWIYAVIGGAVAVGAVIIYANETQDQTQRVELTYPGLRF